MPGRQATPSLESLKMLVAVAANHRWGIKRIDVKRVHFCAKVLREIGVESDDRDGSPGEEDCVGKLNCAMYAAGDAASSLEACCTAAL